MPFTAEYLQSNFGKSKTGLATVGYTLYKDDGTVSVARSTTNVVEEGSSGIYGVRNVTIPDDAFSVLWDTGGGSPVYSAEDLEPLRMQEEVQGKLPTNYIMGSGVQSDKDDEIDAIDTLTVATLDQSLSTTESNIRGADNDDLKDISDEIAAVQADTDDIQTRLPAALVGGKMDSDVGNMQTDVVDANALKTDAAQEIRDEILADSTPFNGADIDTNIGSRASQVSVDTVDANVDDIKAALIADILAATAGSTALAVRTGATQADGFYDDMALVVINAAGVAARGIASYLNANGEFTLDAALPFTPSVADPVFVINRVAVESATEVANAVWNALRSAHTTPNSFGESVRLDTLGLATDAVNEIRDAILSDSTAFAGANIDAAISSRATQAQILSDATPFPGANIDATISSRSTPAQITAAQTAIINRLNTLNQAVETAATGIPTSTNIQTGLTTQVDDFYNNMQLVVINSAGVAVRNINDYIQANGEFVVDALPFTPIATDVVIVLARTGSVPVNVAAIATAVWSEAVPGAFGAGTAGFLLGTYLDAAISSVNTAISLLNNLSIADVQTAMTNQGYTSGRAPNLDNLDATISSVNTAIAALNNISIADVQTALTNQGYTSVRAALLDNLDAAITAVITAIGALNNLSIADVQTAMTSQGYTSVRAILLDNLDAAVSAIPAAVDAVLTVAHGGGSWALTAADADAIRAEIMTYVVNTNILGLTVEQSLDMMRKILNNELSLADGGSGNWTLLDDDDLTTFLTWDVQDKSAGVIVQPPQFPSRRNRGT